jgi:putative hemolysin
VTTRDESPGLIREIGRQREICFRAVGEGTGRELDLDEFDNHYDHLILWHDANREVAGAYRIGRTDRILADQGPKGLYTNTLFRFSRTFLDSVNPGLELGRAFVAGPYQKSYAPLLTLWKGIGAYVAAAPRYAALFGPVSITNDYNPFSRQIMVGFLKAHNWLSTRRRLIRPKAPFRSGRGHIGGLPIKSVSRMCASIEDVSSVIAEMETDGKGVPVLLRQYLKLGGKLVGFNVDHDFAGALDGLMLVDLTRTDAKILERYMGKEAAAGFLAHHAASTPDLCA